MQLPTEIIISIGKYLATRHLASAIRVCKSWNETLIPLLYNTIANGHGQHISREALVRNGHYIRNLDLILEPFLLNRYLGQGPTDPCICLLTVLKLTGEAQTLDCEDDSDGEDYASDDDSQDYESNDNNSTTRSMDGKQVENANSNRWSKSYLVEGITEKNREHTSQVVALVKQNKDLFAFAFNARSSLLDWEPILEHCPPSLQDLWLFGVDLSNRAFQLIFGLGPQLTKLGMIACRIQLSAEEMTSLPGSSTQFPSKQGPTFPNLVELGMDNMFNEFDLPKWMTNCPQVNDLTWFNLSYTEEVLSPSSSTFSIAQVIQAPFWSRIQSLQLSNPRKGLLTDARIAEVLDGCAPLTTFALQGSEMWLLSMDSLERHYPTLERIDVSRGSYRKSWMYQLMLTSCPRLRLFHADAMYACEVVTGDDAAGNRAQVLIVELRNDLKAVGEGQLVEKDILVRHAKRDIKIIRPWVCVGLQSLKLGITSVRDGWDEQIFAQISKLTELKHLDVSMQIRMGGGPFKGRGLDFRLRSGLGLLETIKGLTRVKFDDYYQEHQEVGKDDHAWILKHWPYLTMVNDMHTGYRE